MDSLGWTPRANKEGVNVGITNTNYTILIRFSLKWIMCFFHTGSKVIVAFQLICLVYVCCIVTRQLHWYLIFHIILTNHLLYQSSTGKELWLTLAFSFSEWKWNCLCFTILVHQANIVLHNRGPRLSQFCNSDHGTCENWFFPFWRRADPWLYRTLGLW